MRITSNHLIIMIKHWLGVHSLLLEFAHTMFFHAAWRKKVERNGFCVLTSSVFSALQKVEFSKQRLVHRKTTNHFQTFKKMANVDDQIDAIRAELIRLETEERKLELELKDVLTDIDTPDTSEDEEEEEEEIEEDDWIADLFKIRLLSASGSPSRFCEYLERFQDPIYRRNMRRKMVRLKNCVRASSVADVIRSPEFLNQLIRVQETYPDDGGRKFLNELIAFYCTVNPQ